MLNEIESDDEKDQGIDENQMTDEICHTNEDDQKLICLMKE
jgi:hypothetical protein